MKILVVDDEKFIRKGVVTILEKSGIKSLYLEEAKNGEEALIMHGQNNYDLIISDIRMPKMTGLEFLKAIFRFVEKPHVIFISGFNDFDYAKEAIKYGASAYLLKPINKEELIETVQQIIQARYQKSMKILFRRQLQVLFLQENEVNKQTDIESEPDQSQYFLGLMKMKNINNETHLLEESLQELKTVIYLKGFRANVFLDIDRNIVVITEDLPEILLLFQELKYLSQLTCTLTYSKAYASLEDLKSLFERVSEMARYHKLRHHEVLCEDQIQGKRDDFGTPEEQIKKLNGYIHSAKTENALKLCEMIFGDFVLENCGITHFDALIECTIKEIIEPILNALPQGYQELYTTYESLLNYDTFEHLKTYKEGLLAFISEITNQLMLIKSDKLKIEKVQKAIQYIEENYTNNALNMAMVSNYVSLNYSYFSQLFKEKTGKNFVDFLGEYRTNKALPLLSETTLKIYEVAESVGYREARHFLKVFKAFQGLSPVEYRKKYHFEMIHKI